MIPAVPVNKSPSYSRFNYLAQEDTDGWMQINLQTTSFLITRTAQHITDMLSLWPNGRGRVFEMFKEDLSVCRLTFRQELVSK